MKHIIQKIYCMYQNTEKSKLYKALLEKQMENICNVKLEQRRKKVNTVHRRIPIFYWYKIMIVSNFSLRIELKLCQVIKLFRHFLHRKLYFFQLCFLCSFQYKLHKPSVPYHLPGSHGDFLASLILSIAASSSPFTIKFNQL